MEQKIIRAVVIDDEWYNLEEISDLVKNSGALEVVGRYQNPLQLLLDMDKVPFEVAFIDIEMPEMDGLTLAEKIMEEKPGIRIVFVTSWNQYAVQAFEINAVDYIMKPVRKERFQKMVEKIRHDMNTREFLQSNLSIKCFDKLVTSIGNHPVKWERAKAEELFAFLLMNHGSYVHKDTIMENLWPEHDPTKALPILQTAICRIRNIFSGVREDVVLTYSSSKYCLTLQNTYCDYLEVEKALEEFQKSNDGTYQGIEKAAGLYGKGFLIQESYLWSMGKDEELRKRIGNALRDMIDKVQRTKQDEDVMKYLKLLISLYPYDDEANYTLLNALKQSGKESEMQNHGRWLKKILKEEYDMQPTERIKKLIP